MLISQMVDPRGCTRVLVRQPGGQAQVVNGAESVYKLVLEAANARKSLLQCIADHGLGEEADLTQAYEEGRLLSPITHPDPAHLHLTGTGLTHLGSASTRDAMHTEIGNELGVAELTDSMKMFRMGVKGGKPVAGEPGVQPEWFYKGNGHALVAPGKPIISPAFALDHGEEPELAGIYIVADDGKPFRVGFALANEFSDHVTERMNYLYLAHSKLRPASFGPEIRIGDPIADVNGLSRIRRDGEVVWERPFLSGEKNMSHSFANLEYHHFKYSLFRIPGDVHVHMFGTATLSFADGVCVQEHDELEIYAHEFGLPLYNPVLVAEPEEVSIGML